MMSKISQENETVSSPFVYSVENIFLQLNICQISSTIIRYALILFEISSEYFTTSFLSSNR